MSKETIKIEEDVKERMDALKDDFKYAEPSYSGICEYLLDSHEGDVDGGEELPEGDTKSGDGVTRTNAGGDASTEDGEFLGEEGGNRGLSAGDKAARFRQ